jgi:hypothetical protein
MVAKTGRLEGFEKLSSSPLTSLCAVEAFERHGRDDETYKPSCMGQYFLHAWTEMSRDGLSMGRRWLSIAMAVSVCLALPSTASAQYRPSEAEVVSAKERGEAAAESDWSNAKRSTPSIKEAVKKMNEAFDCHRGRVLSPHARETPLSRYCEDHGWWNNITETLELIGYSKQFWALVTPAAYAHADELPLKVQLGAHGSTTPHLYMLGTADIVIRSLKVNRGKCSYFTDRQFHLPTTLKFGQQLVVVLRSPCLVLEAEIDTDQGSQTYRFDQ